MRRLYLLWTFITSFLYGYLGFTWLLTGDAPNRYVGGVALVFVAVAIWRED